MVHMTCAVTKFCSNPPQQSLGASMSDREAVTSLFAPRILAAEMVPKK